MKNTFKLGFLALAIFLSVAACSSDKKAMGTSDSTSTKVDSSASTITTTDTTKKDTTRTDTTRKP